jgi:tetratricopeptide (TPR) repeat protein
VEASLALSYAALPAEAQAVFAQLGVFVGDFLLEAAEAVVQMPDTPSPIPDTLSLLRRRSLLEYDAASERYDLHDLARAFALPRLVDERAVRLRHARYYQQVAEHAEKELYLKGNPVAGLALFDREQQQIDAAWLWSQKHPHSKEIDQLILDFAGATAHMGDLRYDTQNERIPQLEAQLAAARRLGQQKQEGNALGNLGNAYYSLGDYHKAIEFYEKQLEIARQMGDLRAEGSDLGSLGMAFYALGDYQSAIEYMQQHLDIAYKISDWRSVGIALGNLGSVYKHLGDYRRASELYKQGLTIKYAVGDLKTVAETAWNLGILYETMGELAQSLDVMQMCVSLYHQIGSTATEGCTEKLQSIKLRFEMERANNGLVPQQHETKKYSNQKQTLTGTDWALWELADKVCQLSAFQRHKAFNESLRFSYFVHDEFLPKATMSIDFLLEHQSMEILPESCKTLLLHIARRVSKEVRLLTRLC